MNPVSSEGKRVASGDGRGEVSGLPWAYVNRTLTSLLTPGSSMVTP